LATVIGEYGYIPVHHQQEAQLRRLEEPLQLLVAYY
jgi:hypothetical protein